MKCEACSERLSGYIDGMLEPRDLLQVEQHLRRCGVCAAELEQLRAAIAMLSAMEEVPVPASFRVSLHSRLLEAAAELPKADKVRKLPTRGIFRWAVPAATAAAAAAIVVGLWQNQPAAGQLKVPVVNPDSPVALGSLPPNTGAQNPTNPQDNPTPAPPANTENPGQQANNNTQTGGNPGNPATGTGITEPPKDTPQPPKNGGNKPLPDPQPPVVTPGGSIKPNPNGSSDVIIASNLPVAPQPEDTYKQLQATASYRGVDAAQLKAQVIKHHGSVSEQGQPVDGGVEYLVSVPKSELDHFLAALDLAYTPVQRDRPHEADVTAQVNELIRQYDEARKSSVKQDIQTTGAYLQTELKNLQNLAEVRITLSK